jgi:4a-hydroxytetrahydrobiopterin dehydratase
MPDLLSAEDVQSALANLTGWAGDTSAISRTVEIDDSKREAFTAELQKVAREMDHDPDLEWTEGAVTLTMSTHSAGGVTELDAAYARRANELIAAL